MGGGRSRQSVCRPVALPHSRYCRRPQGRSRTQLCGALIPRAPLPQDGQRPQDDKVWMGPGIAVLVQCICLFVGGLIFRIARRKEDHAI